MKYLEDTLAEQCLSKTLYPNTKIHVRRKKVEGTLMTYTNELEVEIDFSDVDPNLLDESDKINIKPVPTLVGAGANTNSNQGKSQYQEPNLGLGVDKPEPTISGRTNKFFKK